MYFLEKIFIAFNNVSCSIFLSVKYFFVQFVFIFSQIFACCRRFVFLFCNFVFYFCFVLPLLVTCFIMFFLFRCFLCDVFGFYVYVIKHFYRYVCVLAIDVKTAHKLKIYFFIVSLLCHFLTNPVLTEKIIFFYVLREVWHKTKNFLINNMYYYFSSSYYFELPNAIYFLFVKFVTSKHARY